MRYRDLVPRRLHCSFYVSPAASRDFAPSVLQYVVTISSYFIRIKIGYSPFDYQVCLGLLTILICFTSSFSRLSNEYFNQLASAYGHRMYDYILLK